VEVALWTLYRRRAVRIGFSPEAHTTFLCHLHTRGRLRLFALLHTILLAAAVILSFLALW
jgi:hypothetical protein